MPAKAIPSMLELDRDQTGALSKRQTVKRRTARRNASISFLQGDNVRRQFVDDPKNPVGVAFAVCADGLSDIVRRDAKAVPLHRTGAPSLKTPSTTRRGKS